MSGPSRELPPIHVRITADPSSYVKALEKMVDAARKAAADISKNFGKANLDQIKQRRETLRRLGAVDKAYAKQRIAEDKESASARKEIHKDTLDWMRKANKKYADQTRSDAVKNANRLTATFRNMKSGKAAKGGPTLDMLVAGAEKGKASRQQELNRRRKQLDKAAKSDIAAEDKRSAARVKLANDETAEMRKAAQERNAEVERSRKNIERQSQQQAADDKRSTSRMWSRKRDRILGMRRAAEEEAAEEQRVLRRSRLRQVRTGRARQAAWKTSWRNPTTWDGRISRGMESGGNNMMGARADMYMHRQSLQGMVSGAAGFIKPLADFQNYSVGIRQFTGSAQEAKQVLDDLQDFALLSPYTMSSVMEGTTLMMRYGMEAKDAVDMTRMLGDVAGGNAEKLRLLALAVGQTTSIGRLQGQELRQMTEHGFNPLQIAAEHMLGPNASKQDIKDKVYEFSKAMRAGRIDAEFVVKAMEVGTAEGGKYAGQMAAYNKTIDGMTNQILETMTLVKKEIAAIFEKDIEKLLAQVLRYANALVLYLKDAKNADTIKHYATLAAKILGAVAAFHAFGMAVAYSKWMLGSLAIVLGTIWKLLLPFRWLLGQLAWLFVQLAIKAVGSLTAMQLGFAAATVGALAFGAAIAYVLYNANADIIKYNEELKKANELQEELNGINNRRHREEMDKIMAEQDPAKRKQMAADLMARYETELQGKNTNIEKQKALIAAYEPQASRAFQSAQLPLTKQDYEQGRTVGRVVGRAEWAHESDNLKILENDRRTLKNNIESLKDQTGVIGRDTSAGGGAFDIKSWLAPLEPYLKELKEIETKKLDGPVNFDSMIRPEDPEEVKAAKRRMGLGGVSNTPAELPMPTLVGTSTHAERLFKYDQMMKGASATGTPAEQKQISLLQQIAKNTQAQSNRPPTLQDPSQAASFVSGPTN